MRFKGFRAEGGCEARRKKKKAAPKVALRQTGGMLAGGKAARKELCKGGKDKAPCASSSKGLWSNR